MTVSTLDSNEPPEAPGRPSMAPAAPRKTRRRLMSALRATVTLGAFAWLASRIDFTDLVRAFARLDATAVALAVAISFVTLFVGTVRWRLLLEAYGAERHIPLSMLFRLYLIGGFYNTYVPGGVGGDLLRGVATRAAFGDDRVASTTGALSIVFVERVYGLVGMLVVSALASLIWPLPGVPDMSLWALGGVVVAVGVVVALGLAPRLSNLLPGVIGRILAALPRPRDPWRFLGVFALSVLTHGLVGLTGHVIMRVLVPGLPVTSSLVIVPLAAASAFFPLTVGGAGVREAAFVALYGLVGVGKATAIAGSLTFWATQLIVAAVGGVVAVVSPVRAEDVLACAVERSSKLTEP